MPVLVIKEKNGNFKDIFERIFKKFNFFPKGIIFIKPNFSGRAPIIPGENTDSNFLEKLIDCLIKNGASEIIVGHGALLGVPDKQFLFEQIIKEGGFSFLYKKEKVRVLNLDKEERKIEEEGGFYFSIPKIIKKVNSYINLAKLKTHMETKMTLSIKNQMGLVSMADRVNMHRTCLDESIAYLAKAIKPTLCIIDGIIAMEGDGPHHGTSRLLKLIIAGDNMVEVDSTACFLVGVDFKEVKHISTAEKIGVGCYPDTIFLSLIKEYRVLDFKLASEYKKFLKNIYVWPTKACSRCITTLNEYGKFIKKNPIKNSKIIKKGIFGKKINIVIGRADYLELHKEDKIIAIGKCTRCFARKYGIKNLDECPPTVKEVIEYLKKEINTL